jgi:glycine cleavage system T protein
MKDQARVVVIGGGITGCSVLYHLAKAGWTDVVLVEKGELTSGATCHAAGTLTEFNTSKTIMRMRQYSVGLYRELKTYDEIGSLNIASSPEMLKTLQRNVSRAKGIGLNANIISPKEILELLPWASEKDLYGAVYLPEDGQIDPHETTYAVAKAATNLGAEIYTRTRVTGIELTSKGEVSKVKTDKGDIQCEMVVNAAGIWSDKIAAMVGVQIPCSAVVHQHIALEPIPGKEIPIDSPVFRDYEYLVYGRPEGGSYLIGGWEAEPPACWIDGAPWEHESSDVPNDLDRFAPMLEDATKRFPFLADSGLIRLVAHPDAFTPNSEPLLGPWPGVKGFWLAANSSMQGFGGGGGMGKSLAEWMMTGQTEWDIYGFRPWRFNKHYNDPYYAAECAKECYKYYYHTNYPNDEESASRPRRISPFHHRTQDLGAVYGRKNGWERVNYFEPQKSWRRAGEEQREWGGWVEPSYFDTVANECKAVRENVGIFDFTSFGKIDIKGAGALELIQRLTDNDMDRPVGAVIYSQFLNDQGGIVGDVVVTRWANDHFRIISGSGYVDSDLGWIKLQQLESDPPVSVLDATEDYAVIGLWGPKARQVLQKITTEDMSNEAFPYMTAKSFDINGVEVLAQRVTYVGELGWELQVPSNKAIFIWDQLWAAGQEHQITPCGYKAIDSLRLEKGFLGLTSDITALETPYEARLGFCVKLKANNNFIGKQALEKVKADGVQQKLCTVTVGSEDYLTLYGGEAVLSQGETVSRLRSAGYGHYISKNIAYTYLPLELAKEGTELSVEIFGEQVQAVVTADALYDPKNKTILS